MKKLLFIIPSLSIGGTNSSLDSFYTRLKDQFDIDVFAIVHLPRKYRYSFDEVLLPKDPILSFVYGNLVDQKGLDKLKAVFIKLLTVFFRALGKNYGQKRSKKVVRLLENKQVYDYVISFQEGYATKITALFKNSNKIAWIHCNYNKYLSKEQSEEKIYSSFKTIVCVSEYTAMVFKQRYPGLAERTIAIHNLIDTVRIRQQGENPICDSRFVMEGNTLLSVGRLSPVKRFREIPFVASIVKKRGIRFNWYILGMDNDSNESYLLKENIEKYNVQDCVRWLGGKSNPYPYFKASSIYVCLSETEACPMVFKEAQAFNLPIVTTAFPSSYEFIHGEEGVIVPFEELADAIVAMVEKIEKGFKLSVKTDDGVNVMKKMYQLFNVTE